MVDFVIFIAMKEEQKIYRKLYDRYGFILHPYGIPSGQPIEEDYRVSSLCIDNCPFVIVCECYAPCVRKMVIAPDIIYDSANNCYNVVANKNSNVKLLSLSDYKPYDYDEYDKMCKHIDYILYRKKEIELERKMKRIDEDF
jgi:hypothetical protein